MKNVKRFGVKGKLAPHYIGPFPIIEKCGSMAYKLKKCLKAVMDVVLLEVTPLEADLMYLEYSIKILDQKNCVTRHETIKFFKIQWSNYSESKATWESEDFLYSHRREELYDCLLHLLGPFSFSNLRTIFLLRERL
jgi:hypothetical protein